MILTNLRVRHVDHTVKLQRIIKCIPEKWWLVSKTNCSNAFIYRDWTEQRVGEFNYSIQAPTTLLLKIFVSCHHTHRCTYNAYNKYVHMYSSGVVVLKSKPSQPHTFPLGNVHFSLGTSSHFSPC